MNISDRGGNCVWDACVCEVAALAAVTVAVYGAYIMAKDALGKSIVDVPDLSIEGMTGFPEDGARILDTPIQQPEPWVEGFTAEGPQGPNALVTPITEETGPNIVTMGNVRVDGILRPSGSFVGEVIRGATENIRTVSSADFDRIKGQLLDGASQAGTYAGGKGTWYQLPDGGRIGVRESEGHGTTLDVDVPGIRSDLKVHQDD